MGATTGGADGSGGGATAAAAGDDDMVFLRCKSSSVGYDLGAVGGTAKLTDLPVKRENQLPIL